MGSIDPPRDPGNLRDAPEAGESVANVVDESLAEWMNLASGDDSPETSLKGRVERGAASPPAARRPE
jgi:hypothetical protein